MPRQLRRHNPINIHPYHITRLHLSSTVRIMGREDLFAQGHAPSSFRTRRKGLQRRLATIRRIERFQPRGDEEEHFGIFFGAERAFCTVAQAAKVGGQNGDGIDVLEGFGFAVEMGGGEDGGEGLEVL